MSYEKLTDPTLADIDEAVAAALAQNKVRYADLAADLVAAGAVVQLGTGQIVWCSCVAHDLPETPEIDFLVVAIEIIDGAARVKPNGQQVSVVTWRSVRPEHLDSWGIDTIRKACLMVALGEPQPQVPIDVPAEGGATTMDVFGFHDDMDRANGCILSVSAAADQLAAPLTDVL